MKILKKLSYLKLKIWFKEKICKIRGIIRVVFRQKKIWIFVLSAAAGIFVLVNLVLIFYPFDNPTPVFTIPQGASRGEIAYLLKENKIIKSSFHLLLCTRGISPKYGEYEFAPRISTRNVARIITQGKVKIYRITIPEGQMNEEIAPRLSREKLVRYQRFMDLVTNGHFEIEDYKFPANLEGYLFPDTYYFTKSVNNEEVIIARMLSQFKRKVIDQCREGLAKSAYSLAEIITLASIVEKEAMVAWERPVIAKVFYNRLKKGMALQADPTIRFAVKKYSGRITYKDLRVRSAYNTYIHPGIPPGPICNPGLNSIKATLNPDDVDYLYFVSRNDGTHEFSFTYRQHLLAKNKYQNK